jgi:membrane-bound serine protease (ClpP class)
VGFPPWPATLPLDLSGRLILTKPCREKMNFLINPNLAYLFVVAAVMLTIASLLFPRSNLSKIGSLVCLLGAGFELFNLQANPWALIVTALSPLPYFFAIRSTGLRRLFLAVTAAMLIFGSVFLLVDQNGTPVVNTGLLWLVSLICAQFIWVGTERRLNIQSAWRGVDPDSLVGLVGTATTRVEDVGLVQIEGETCSARSDQPIPAGSPVRVLKAEGRILVVKKVEKLTKE